MRLTLVADEAEKLNTTKISHKQMSYNTSVVLYVKSLLRIKFDIYGEINGFLESLPLYQQDKIYDQYHKVFAAMNNIYGDKIGQDTVARISTEVARLYDLIPEEACNAWITDPRSGIKLPPEADKSGQITYADMTYSLDDHIKLAGYAMALRLMMPVWGMYNRGVNEERETAFKELNAVRLISESWLANCAARDRLIPYINRVLQTSSTSVRNNVTAAFAGIGRDEASDFHLARVTVRRLPISPISNFDDSDKSTLVSNVYNYIKPTHMTSLERNFDATVDDKHRLLHDKDEDRSSYTENYKIKEFLSAGDSVVISRALSKPIPLARRIDPSIPADLVHQCYKVRNMHDVSQLTYHQIALLKMVVGITASPLAVDCVDRPAILSIIAAVQAALWHWGFQSLAVMLTVKSAEDGLRRESGQSNRLTKDETLKLREHYPFHLPVGRNFKGDDYVKMEKENTTSFIVIRDFVIASESQVWHTSCPDGLLDQYIGGSSERLIVTPDNIRSMLAKLIFKINEMIEENAKRQ